MRLRQDDGEFNAGPDSILKFYLKKNYTPVVHLTPTKVPKEVNCSPRA